MKLNSIKGPCGSMSSWITYQLMQACHQYAWVRAWFCKLQKRFNRLAAASDNAYQLLAHGQWLSPGTPASSTTKTGRHDITGILLKVALNTKQSISQSN